MSVKAMPVAETANEVDRSRLGDGAYAWKVSPTHVDLSMPPAKPLLATSVAEPQTIALDLKRSAMIVVDMQNDFCAPGGWVDWLGADLSPSARQSSHGSVSFQRCAAQEFQSSGSTGATDWIARTCRRPLFMCSVATVTASVSEVSCQATVRICLRRTAGRPPSSMNSSSFQKISRPTSAGSAAFGTHRWTASSRILM